MAAAAISAAACKSDGAGTPAGEPPESDPAPPSSAADAGAVRPEIPASDAGAATTAAVTPLDIPLADRCDSPCLLLAEHRFSAISQGAYCEICKGVKARACELEWPPIGTDEGAPSCDDWDQWRRCVLAAHGYRFRSARARAEFRRKRWYEPRRFRPSAIGGVARANLEYLRSKATACREALAARAGRIIAKLRGDLDGDRRPERAVVTDAEIRVGQTRTVHGLDPGAMAAIEASLVDIDAGDRAVEILVALHSGDTAPSRYVIAYVSGEPERRRRKRPGPLVVSEVIETFGTVEATGAGALEIREERCGQIKLRSLRYKDGRLVVASDTTEGSYDPARCD